MTVASIAFWVLQHRSSSAVARNRAVVARFPDLVTDPTEGFLRSRGRGPSGRSDGTVGRPRHDRGFIGGASGLAAEGTQCHVPVFVSWYMIEPMISCSKTSWLSTRLTLVVAVVVVRRIGFRRLRSRPDEILSCETHCECGNRA